ASELPRGGCPGCGRLGSQYLSHQETFENSEGQAGKDFCEKLMLRESHLPLWKSFRRSQFSALVATALDFGTLWSLVEVAKLWYLAAVVFGALVGAVTNFLLNRHWSFEVEDAHWNSQARKYALVSLGSLALNAAGVFLLTDVVGLKYLGSKVVTSLVVALFFNFPLHRKFVFAS
ncbi:MAG: hypothetical protein RJB38_378, partial [Pseudomonadota bacterium]